MIKSIRVKLLDRETGKWLKERDRFNKSDIHEAPDHEFVEFEDATVFSMDETGRPWCYCQSSNLDCVVVSVIAATSAQGTVVKSELVDGSIDVTVRLKSYADYPKVMGTATICS